jgi:hypothetical protein
VRVRRELDRFVALVSTGKAPDRVLEEIASRELRIKDVEAELARLRIPQPTRLDIARIRALALARARDLRATLYADVA